MAKWGEGDPRWIVEERPDAVNVNNWHWTEKNACGWSRQKFKDLFTDYKIENELFKCKISEVEKCEGEAVANNRKGKLIFFYEWDLTLKWKGKLVNGDKYVTGKVNIPNLSEENEVREVDINVTVNESTQDADVLKECMREVGSDKIREQLEKYVQGLRAEFSQGMILPKKDGDDAKHKDSINNLSSNLQTKVQMNNTNPTEQGKSALSNAQSVGHKLKMSSVEMNQNFQCTGEELYRALTVTEMMVAFSRGPVISDVKKGGKFELFGGNIHGEYIELVPGKKIVQKWRYKKWPDGHYSTVTMEIEQESDHTELKLRQTDVPASEADTTRENWERYYWDSLKRTFGFGYFM